VKTLTAYVFSPHSRELFDGEIGRRMIRRLNALATVEINLWGFAAQAGHTEPPPYACRYDLAGWLWHPAIPGHILCLRCGDEVLYLRRGRTGLVSDRGSRTARCRACSRGREHDWPAHAVEPYRRGTWLLRCTTAGCTELFVGRRQAKHCEHHRLNRLTLSMRAKAT
jgi:hypothetical protein